ncbi:E3 ubiquitin-protein ligase AIP2 [Cucumis sativus]|uniref:RING-type E3 ubiquitin transferase n=1 Tax=Cucumis sativus TaxID=3659 RepID=A0A0A0L2Z0_CUCSA|nr:E3 ubiquitin-protein ligase AIP2 [Cucumis sativus]KGN55399.1 hypothetical protein Csa_012794 [Cucumis sativus]
MDVEESVRLRLEILYAQLGKKHTFEEGVSNITTLLQDRYPDASPDLRKSFYYIICRVATLLRSRFTAPGFWLSGLKLFQFSLTLLSDQSEIKHLQACVAQAEEILRVIDDPPPQSQSTSSNTGYLFEGHLTVDPEPPQPQWLVQSNLVTAAAAALSNVESSQPSGENNNVSESVAGILLALNGDLETVINALNVDTVDQPPKAPPASKEVVANLPVTIITDEILAKLGKDVQCAICKENFAVDDKKQELPCKHAFHQDCLKPWLDSNNSCPICRHELPTDDQEYENWKEREREAEEARRGAENAVRGGEYMYV